MSTVTTRMARSRPPQRVDQRRHVEHVAQALAVGLEQEREASGTRRHREQIRGALPLLPERGPCTGPAPGKEQCAGGVLAELRCEERRRPELAHDQRLHLVGRGEQQHPRRAACRCPGSGPRMPSLVHIVSTSSPSWSRTRAVRAIDQGACTRPPSGERMQTRQSPSSSRVRSTTSVRSSGTSPVARAWSSRYWRRFSAAWPSSWCSRTSRDTAAARRDLAELAHQPADELARLERTRRGVPVPEGHLPRLSRSRRDQHPVVGDLLDPPRRGAEQEDLAHLALEHHLLVQLAHPGVRLLTAGEEHAVEAAVGDGAAVDDGDPLGALAGDDRVATRSQVTRGRSSAKSSEANRPERRSSTLSNTVRLSSANGAAPRTAA